MFGKSLNNIVDRTASSARGANTNQAHSLIRHCLHRCTQRRHQASVPAGTVFEHTKLPLPKWFAATNLMSSDIGGISATRLSQMVGISWISAQLLLRNLRQTMVRSRSALSAQWLVKVNDAFIGGKSRSSPQSNAAPMGQVSWRWKSSNG